ncbi:uncharacterized protein BDZ83DRAFT_148536 [Colletotrichum acutatum]|uniref:Uncharacterized protein n=1 Tax=Glomerella acutata TaxID=27357 RepID=A0AAD8UTA8_GLOAC|nr:uncharacterized protein BDZ83DRAFT_148536 [Colletotrichum acutatum]KAK1728075.1 hypothetical protein BDZ83DRAFT_148536 [Colletotrichum acutatum]
MPCFELLAYLPGVSRLRCRILHSCLWLKGVEAVTSGTHMRDIGDHMRLHCGIPDGSDLRAKAGGPGWVWRLLVFPSLARLDQEQDLAGIRRYERKQPAFPDWKHPLPLSGSILYSSLVAVISTAMHRVWPALRALGFFVRARGPSRIGDFVVPASQRGQRLSNSQSQRACTAAVAK